MVKGEHAIGFDHFVNMRPATQRFVAVKVIRHDRQITQVRLGPSPNEKANLASVFTFKTCGGFRSTRVLSYLSRQPSSGL